MYALSAGIMVSDDITYKYIVLTLCLIEKRCWGFWGFLFRLNYNFTIYQSKIK